MRAAEQCDCFGFSRRLCCPPPKSMTHKAPPTQIVIATADLRSRICLRTVLRSQPDFNVAGEVSDEAGLLVLRRQLQPDILLLDSALAGLVNGAVSSWPGVRIILLAAVIDEGHVTRALRLPARGILSITAPPHELLKSIRSVMAEQYWLGADGIAILIKMLRDLLLKSDAEPASDGYGLTAREHNIIAKIATGHSNRQIARELSVSERTVKHHLTSIFGKLGISSRLQLAAFAITHRVAFNASRAGAASALSS
jgi:two-component system, NarL family, nitrate/nitrite response regulator NarL